MIKIRHLKSGSIMGHYLCVATRGRNKISYDLSYFVQDGNIEYEEECIPSFEVGWMYPANRKQKFRPLVSKLEIEKEHQSSTVTHPMTGAKQHSVVHASLNGSIDEFEPDVSYVQDTINGVTVKCISYRDRWNTEHRVVDSNNPKVLRWFLDFSWPVTGPYSDPIWIYGDGYIGIAAAGAYRFTYSYSPVYLSSVGYRASGSGDSIRSTYDWPTESWPDYQNPPPLNRDDVDKKISSSLPADSRRPEGWPFGAKPKEDLPSSDKLVNILNSMVNTFTWEYERVVYPQTRQNYSQLCLNAVDNSRFIMSNQLEFWKDVGMTFSEFGALKTFAENLTERIVKSPDIRKHAKNITRNIKKRYNILHGRKYGSQSTVDALSDAEISKWLSQQYLTNIVGGQVGDVANTYLAHYYGTRLAMADIEEMSNGLSKFIWTYYSEFRKRARNLHEHMDFEMTTQFGLAKTQQNYNLLYNPYAGISEISEIVNELGFGVDFHQVWECIPLSFVVDWVFNITDVLKAIDLQNYLTKLDIYYEGISSDTRIDVSEAIKSRWGWNCNLEYSYYERLYSPIPTIHPSATNIVGKPQKHFIQGAALLCSR